VDTKKTLNGYKKTPTNPKGAGCPTIKLNWEDIDKLCFIQCTLREIASFCNCSEDKIEIACHKEKNMKFSEYSELKRGNGKVALRRTQWRLAVEKEDKTMLIWLGKQHLGQSDKQELTGKNGQAIELNVDYKTLLLEKLKYDGDKTI
jgi:hypothetical protein